MHREIIQIKTNPGMTGIWIPVKTFVLPICWEQKIIMEDVRDLQPYFKGNQVIGEFIGVSSRQASRLIGELLDISYLKASYKKGKIGRIRHLEVTKAFLFLSPEGINSTPKMARTPRQKWRAPLDKNGERVLSSSNINEYMQKPNKQIDLMIRLKRIFPTRPWSTNEALWQKVESFRRAGQFDSMVSCVQEYQEEQTG